MSHAARALLSSAANGQCKVSDYGLTPEDMPDMFLGGILAVIMDLESNGFTPDLGLVMDRCQIKGCGSPDQIAESIGFVETTRSPASLADEVRQMSTWRRLASRVSSFAAKMASTPVEDQAASLDLLRASLDEAGSIESTLRPKTWVEASRDMVQGIRDAKTGVSMVPSGFERWDKAVGGLRAGAVYTIAAVTGGGKSSWCIQAAGETAKATPTLYMSFEMPAREIAAKVIAQRSTFTTRQIRDGDFDKNSFARLIGVIEKCNELGLQIYDRRPDVPEMLSQIRRWHRSCAGKVVVVDHIGLVKPDRAPSRDREVASVCEPLKSLAIELGISIIMVSQCSRAFQRDKREPELHDLRDSGTVEQISDVVTFVTRSERGDEGTVFVRKARNGQCGKIDMRFHGAHQRFEEK